MKVKVFGKNGSVTKEIELANDVFAIEVRQGSIYHAINNELANKRTGTASCIGRSDVKGSTRKLWRQKGTGRARAGSKKNPVWVGGGVTFGPKLRNYNYKIPKKVKQLAIRSILSQKNKEKRIKVIEDFTVNSGKTKDLLKILKKLVKDERTVIILSDNDMMIKRAGNNIPWLNFLNFNRLRTHDIFYSKNILLFEKAALGLNNFYGAKKNG